MFFYSVARFVDKIDVHWLLLASYCQAIVLKVYIIVHVTGMVNVTNRDGIDCLIA